MMQRRQEQGTKKCIVGFLAGVAVALSLSVFVPYLVVAEPLVDIIEFAVTPGLFVDFDDSSISFVLDPDHAPSSAASRALVIGTNASPTFFNIGLVSVVGDLDFSYRLVKEGEGVPVWQDIPIMPTVASEELPDIGVTPYTLDLQAAAGPGLSASNYQAEVQLQFQGAGTIWVYTLHLEITVLGRAPVVDAGPDQTVNEGDAVAFSGGFVDPDQGETHTIAWNFGDGATASGTLTPTHTYSDDGTYTVSLTVTDSGGRAGRDTLTIIANDLGPTAHVESVPSITPPAMFAIDAGEQASFDASHSISNPDEIVSYEWDWNYDRLTGFVASDDVGKVAAHTFSEAGTYTIAMRVTDDDGSTDVATIDIIVNSVATIEASLASAEISGGGGAVVGAEVAIDELYIHHEALALTQFHLASMGAPEEGSSPVIYFPFNEGDGRYIYNEIDRQSGKEPVLQGTLSQTEWIKDEPAYGNGFALSLGQEGFVEIPADSRMDFAWNQDFTLELWVRSTDGTAKRTLVQRKRSDDSLLYSLNLFKGVPLFQLTTTTDSYAIVKGYETIADGTWHHIACVRDMGALKLYVDGDLVNELLPEARIAGAGGGNLSSGEPTYLGEAEEGKEMMGGLVNALYRIGEAIEFRLRITNETGQLAADESPTLLFVQYDFAGVKISSGYIGRLNYRQEEQVYAYSLDTSLYDDGIYEFFLVTDDGLQETLRIMLLEVE